MFFIVLLTIFTASDSIKDYHILQGIDYIYQEDYDAASREFTTLTTLYPDDPEGFFYLATLLETILSFENKPQMQTKLDSIASVAVELAEQKLKQDYSAYNLFYVGSTRGERAAHRGLRGNWMGCFTDGIRAKRTIELALKADSTLFDVYAGLGLYDYYLGKYLAFIPTLRKRKARGLEELKIAMNKGKYAKRPAAFFLLRAYILEGMYEKAYEIIQKMRKIYPNNTALLYDEAEVYFYTQNWQHAVEYCEQSLALSEQHNPRNRRVRGSCYLLLAKTYYKFENQKQTKNNCYLTIKEVNGINADWAAGLRKEAQELIRKCPTSI